MTEPAHLLAIDQGTTSTRAIVFRDDGTPVASAQHELVQIFPEDGWVEHDAEEIWSSTVAVAREALVRFAPGAGAIRAIGITNQRETTVLWDRKSGKPLHNAIVWQDRRTAALCERLVREGHEALVSARTGLLLDPYFSATKLAWLLDNVNGARARAERGELAFGTTDCFLLWRLTGGAVHATDATNASRTLLFNIHDGRWDSDLLDLFDIPAAVLPQVKDSADDFGRSLPGLLGASIPIGGVAGDQQAAAIGQACFEPGMVKSTYGTGCFVLLNTGAQALVSSNRLLTTIAYQVKGRRSYALEGSIFVAGAAVQWLRDGLHVIDSAAESEGLAAALDSTAGVYLVPAFTGLGAPYWDPHARGAILGLTRASTRETLVRAALESVCYQTVDLLEAMARDAGGHPTALRVDGGMAVNDWLMRYLADMLDLPVERPAVTETTALGAACLAGLSAGVFASLDECAQRWQCAARFEPAMTREQREPLLDGWKDAVSRVRTRP